MDKIAEELFEALTTGGSLAPLGAAMAAYKAQYAQNVRISLRQQPGFRKLWQAMEEAVSYEMPHGCPAAANGTKAAPQEP